MSRIPLHDNITPILNISHNAAKKKIWVVSQYMGEATSFNKLIKNKAKLDSTKWMEIFYRMAAGLSHLETEGVPHPNINP